MFHDCFEFLKIAPCLFVGFTTLRSHGEVTSWRDFIADPLAGLLETILRRFISFLETVLGAVPGGFGGVFTSSSCLFNPAVWSRNASSLGLAPALMASLDFSMRAPS